MEIYVTREECEKHRKEMDKKHTNCHVDTAIIKTKLNIIMGVMSALGIAVAGVLVKMLFA